MSKEGITVIHTLTNLCLCFGILVHLKKMSGQDSEISLSTKFPFNVEFESLKENRAKLRIINYRDIPLDFKCFLVQPDSIEVKPSSGTINGKSSTKIRVKRTKQQSSQEIDSTVKFCTYFKDNSRGDSRTCDCTFQPDRQEVFEKTLNIPLGGSTKAGLKLRDSWNYVKTKGFKLRDSWNYVKTKAKDIIWKPVEWRSLFFSALIWMLIIYLILAPVFRVVCRKEENSNPHLWCRLPSWCPWSDDPSCKPKWKYYLSDIMCPENYFKIETD